MRVQPARRVNDGLFTGHLADGSKLVIESRVGDEWSWFILRHNGEALQGDAAGFDQALQHAKQAAGAANQRDHWGDKVIVAIAKESTSVKK